MAGTDYHYFRIEYKKKNDKEWSQWPIIWVLKDALKKYTLFQRWYKESRLIRVDVKETTVK